MRRTGLGLFLTAALITSSTLPAQGADLKVSAQSAVSGFQSSLNTILDQIETLSREHERNVADINQVNLDSIAKINTTQTTDLAGLATNYLPKMSASSTSIALAKTKILTVSGVKVLQLGNNRNYWGNLKCPILRPDCKSLDDKGALFKVGEVTTFLDEVTQRADYLYEIDLMISYGLIELLSPIEFQSAATTIRSEPASLDALTASYSNARIAAQTKYNKAAEVIKIATNSALAFENNRYEQALAELEAQQAQAETFILAAKRATKDYKTFDKAFTAALQFEHNRSQLNEIADLPWTAFTSLRSLSSLSKVIALTDFANAVAAKYTLANALKLNSSVGNTFVKEPAFNVSLKAAKALYKKAIKS